MKTDIRDRKDIEKLINTFYDQVKTDEVIGYLFTDVAKVNWEVHLPKMYDFWENILFYSAKYKGNPMVVHKELHKKSSLNEQHFQQWTTLFTTTVDQLFEGAKATEIKNKALNIASIMSYKTLLQ